MGRKGGLQLTHGDRVVDVSMADVATPHRKVRHAKQFTVDNGSIIDDALLDAPDVAMGAGFPVVVIIGVENELAGCISAFLIEDMLPFANHVFVCAV